MAALGRRSGRQLAFLALSTTVLLRQVPSSPIPCAHAFVPPVGRPHAPLSAALRFNRSPPGLGSRPRPVTTTREDTIEKKRYRRLMLTSLKRSNRVTRNSPPQHISPAAMASSAEAAEGSPPSRLDKLQRLASSFCNLFPLWTVLTSLLALTRPSVFDAVDTSYFTAMIGALMLCMGITLKPSDFKRVAQRPAAVLLAFVGCYGIMPALALTIGKALGLSEGLAAGLVLVSCINGAQASNLCTYIGQGDLALSVLMTTMTTVGAIVMTPLTGKFLLGQVVPVNAAAVARSTVEVVLGPILLGMSVNARFPKFVQAVLPFSPIVGVIVTCLLVGSAVAGCAAPILAAGPKLQLAAFLLHALGGVAGYAFTKPFYGEDVCRTFAIEFAMKSSAFGYLLACLHFADPAVRVPSAVSIVWMTLIGSSLAVASRFFPPKECIVD